MLWIPFIFNKESVQSSKLHKGSQILVKVTFQMDSMLNLVESVKMRSEPCKLLYLHTTLLQV